MRFDYRMTNLLVAALIALLVSGCSSRDIAGDAEAAARSGQYEKAIKLYSQVVNASDDPGVFGNRGNCYSYIGNLDAALADYQTALDKIKARSPAGNDPILPSIYYNRGYAYNRAKKFELAIQDFEKTIAIKSDYPDVTNSLAWLLATCPVAKIRNPKRALQLAEVELKRSPENPAVLDTAAACYAATGDCARAATTQEKAIKLCFDPSSKQGYQERLALYKIQKPYVEPADPK